MSDWQAQNQEVWEALTYSLGHLTRSTIAWITCDSHHHLRHLVREFKFKFPASRHFEHRVTEFKENSFPPYFRNHLPAEAFEKSEALTFVHLFGLEQHVGIGNSAPFSRLFEAINFEREIVFRDFPFVIVIWSDTYSQIKAQVLAPDFWDWLTEKFHFEAPDVAVEQELAFLNENKDLVAPERRDELYLQISKHLHLLEQTIRPTDRLSLLEVIADNYQALQDYDRAIAYRKQVLELGELLTPRAKARHLNQQGFAFQKIGENQVALEYYERSLKIWQEISDNAGEGTTLNNISQIYKARGDYDTALRYLEQSLKIQQEIGDHSGKGATLNNLATVAVAGGDYDTALSYLEQSLKIRQEIGDRAGEGAALNNISQIYDARGDYDTALRYLEQSLKISQEIGDRAGEGVTLNNISQIYDAKGDYDTALRYLEQSLKIRREIGDISGTANTLHNLGAISFERENYAEAIAYFQKSCNILKQIDSPDAKHPKEYLTLIRTKIGEERYQEIISKVGLDEV